MNVSASEKPDGGYLGRAARKYSAELAQAAFDKAVLLVKKITGGTEQQALAYLNSAHGHHFFGRENDNEFLKTDFDEFLHPEELPRLKEMLMIIGE